MRAGLEKIGRRLLLLVLLALAGGLLGATLVRFAPGYGVDERELDPRLSQASVEAIRGEHQMRSGLLAYYGRYLAGAVRGDLGTSEWLQQPIASLIKERLPVTARSVAFGVALAWVLALALALSGLGFRSEFLDLSGIFASGLLIALPAVVIALISVYLRAPVFVAITAVTFPKVFRYTRNLLSQAGAQPCVLGAQARGIGRIRILFCHILPLVAPTLLALLGVSVSLAFGAAIPIEALCDSPGVGQLAWQAALNRDLPLMMNVTLLVTLITVAANSVANAAHERAL